MADERLTDRTTLSELADGDLIHVVDISDTTDNPLGTSKKGLWSLFKSTLLTYFNTQYLRSVTGDSVDNTDPLNPVVNAIPLSGTEVGSPVTGDVQFQNDTKLILNDVGGDIGFIQGRSDGIIEIGSDAYPVLISGDAGLNVTKVIQAEGGIQGDGTGNELRITGNDTGRGLIGIEYYGANYDNKTYVQKKYVDDKYIFSGTTNYISKFTGSNSIGNSQIYDNGTNLGVGNTSPSYKLDVSGTGRFTSDLTVQGTGNSSFAGKVGIGTTSPNHELVVQGASSPNIELKNSNYSNGGFVLNRANYTQQWKWWAESSQMYFSFATDESTYSNKMTILSSGNVGIGTTSAPTYKLDVSGTGRFTDTLTVQGKGNSSFAGKVGIGSASPTSKLQVVGLPNYADNAAALAGGLTVGAFYHTAGLLKVVI
jgi:hypothetical protein